MKQSKFAPPPDSLRNAQKLFEEYLAEKSLRLTPQRRLILDYFLHAEWHQSAEELYRQIRKIEPGIGFSTLYRTLKLLCECNLARELALGDERSHFEPMYKVQHHDHLVCTECGKINEFYCQEIEDLQQKICAEQGFSLGSHTHEIYGQCTDCQKKSGGKHLPLRKKQTVGSHVNGKRITSLIIDDHLNAEKLLDEFQKLKGKDFPAAKTLFLKIKTELEKHMGNEEKVLFPLFESRTGLQGSGPTSTMKNEHKHIRSLLNDLQVLLMHRKTKKDEHQENILVNRLLKILKSHEDKEEEVFYPWLDKMLPEVEKEMAVAQIGNSVLSK